MKFSAPWALVGMIVGATASAVAAGFLTSNLPIVSSGTVNGTTLVFPNGVVSELLPNMLVPVDTELAGGQAPQSVAAGAFQIAALYGEAAGNTATSTAGAATLNTKAGVITTESLSTAPGSTYTFTLTNSLITSATQAAPYVAMYSKTNTGGAITLTSVTNASGSSVFVFTNTGTTAFNGTMTIVFHI